MANKEYSRAYYLKNRETFLKKRREYIKANRASVLEKKKQFYQDNKENIAKKQAEWRKENLDKVNGYTRAYYYRQKEKGVVRKRNTDKDRADGRERSRKWYHNHPEYIKQYSARNRPKINTIASHRRALKLKATPKWADKEEIKKIYEMADFMTRYTGIAHHVDHVYPLKGKTVTGLHTHTNLRVIPAKLNRQKSNKIGYEVYDKED